MMEQACRLTIYCIWSQNTRTAQHPRFYHFSYPLCSSLLAVVTSTIYYNVHISFYPPFLPLLNQMGSGKISPSYITASSEVKVSSMGKSNSVFLVACELFQLSVYLLFLWGWASTWIITVGCREAGRYMCQTTTLYSINLYNCYAPTVKPNKIKPVETMPTGVAEMPRCSSILTSSVTCLTWGSRSAT